jgi:hypothetical protein
MGKPTISYTPIMDKKLTAFVPIKVSRIAKTVNEVVGLVKRAVDDESEVFKKNKNGKVNEITEIIANLEIDSADKIVDFIDMKRIEWFEEVKRHSNISGMARIMGYRLKSYLIDVLYMTGLRKRAGNIFQYTQSKFPGLKKNDLELRLKILDGIERDMPHFEISKILRNTFLLKTENNKHGL